MLTTVAMQDFFSGGVSSLITMHHTSTISFLSKTTWEEILKIQMLHTPTPNFLCWTLVVQRTLYRNVLHPILCMYGRLNESWVDDWKVYTIQWVMWKFSLIKNVTKPSYLSFQNFLVCQCSKGCYIHYVINFRQWEQVVIFYLAKIST